MSVRVNVIWTPGLGYGTPGYEKIRVGLVALPAMGHWGTCPSSTPNNFVFSSLSSKYDSQLYKYCVVCENTWCRRQ